MMMDRSTVDAICRTMGSAKAPDLVEVPISIVGFACATTSAIYAVIPDPDQMDFAPYPPRGHRRRAARPPRAGPGPLPIHAQRSTMLT